MLGNYLSGEYDLANSYVIGDRLTDMQLAVNLGAKGIWLRPDDGEARRLLTENPAISPVLITDDWDRITEYLLPENAGPLFDVRQGRRIFLWK